MNRNSATRLLAEKLTDEVVVSNLGQATLELQQVADRDLNFYTFGSMGQCSSIALGIAPKELVAGADSGHRGNNVAGMVIEQDPSRNFGCDLAHSTDRVMVEGVNGARRT